MKKSDTIALYRDAYLEGRDEVDRRNFEEKDENRQYAAIMSWKRRQEIAAGAKEAVNANTPNGVYDLVKKAHKALLALNELQQKDQLRLMEAVDRLKEDTDNFEQILKGRRLKELRAQLSNLNREIEQLENEGVQEC